MVYSSVYFIIPVNAVGSELQNVQFLYWIHVPVTVGVKYPTAEYGRYDQSATISLGVAHLYYSIYIGTHLYEYSRVVDEISYREISRNS
jgi:hypothetical protein